MTGQLTKKLLKDEKTKIWTRKNLKRFIAFVEIKTF